MYRFLTVTKNIITLEDIRHVNGFNPVIVNFGMYDKTLAKSLMVKNIDEYLGVKISEEYAEKVIDNYDVNDPDYVIGVIKDIKHMFHSKSNKKNNNYVLV